MALKDYPTHEILAEVFRRDHGCPRCIAYRAEMQSIADIVGEAQMASALGYHYEAVKNVLDDRSRAISDLVGQVNRHRSFIAAHILNGVDACPGCGADPGCNIDCDVCMIVHNYGSPNREKGDTK